MRPLSDESHSSSSPPQYADAISFAAKSVGFIAIYTVIERTTFIHQLDGLGITLWSPSAGLSLLMLMLGGAMYTVAVFAASLLTDYLIYSGPRGLFAPVATSLIQSAGLCAIALSLRAAWSSKPPLVRQMLTLLTIVPAGVLIMAFAFCLVLLADGQLPPERFLLALRNYWIGNTLGIVTLVPFALAAILQLDRRSLRLTYAVRAFDTFSVGFFLLVLACSLIAIFGVQRASDYQFFYLLFLPTVWISMRLGFSGAAFGLLATHLSLVTTATLMGHASADFISYQLLMLVLSTTGLLLGSAITQIRGYDERMRRQDSDLARATRQALIGATGTALAHEVSQPLASTANYVHAARRLVSATQSAGQGALADTLASAAREADRARQTLERVRDFLSFGRVELKTVDVQRVSQSALNSVARDPHYNAVSWSLEGDGTVPTVAADAIQLQQALLNLLLNAAEAVTREGRRDGKVRISFDADEQFVDIHVEDNGPGVLAEMAQHLFEPFESTTPNGMGLGLTLVRQIARAHSGEVKWENCPIGARFTISIPRSAPDGDVHA